MSKKVKDNLHDLIQSLTKSEKRYFKLMSTRHTIGEVNNYILFFDFLEELEEYDEDAVFKHFKGEAFLNNFSITKKRLYDNILQALDLYHSDTSIDASLYKSLHAADILYNKSLYKQVRRILNSIEKTALKHEKYNVLIEISNRRKKLCENIGYANVKEEDIAAIRTNDLNYIEQITNFSEAWFTKSKLFMELSTKGIARTKSAKKNYDDIFNNFHQSFPKKTASFESVYLAMHTKSAYFYAINHLQKCNEVLLDLIKLLEKNKKFIKEQPNSYFSVITNAIYVQERLGEFQRANALLNKLKSMKTNYKLQSNEDFEIKLFSSSNSIELSLCIKRGGYEKARTLIPGIESGLLLYNKKLSPQRKAFLDFKIAGIYLATGNCHEALQWVNRIFNDKELNISEDIIAFTYLLELIIHIELENDTLLPYTIKNAQRYLKKKNRLYDFEKITLTFITKLIKAKNVFEKEKIWSDLHLELRQIKDDSYQQIALEYFDFETWAKAKAERKAFSQLIQEKFVNRTRKLAKAS